MLQVTDARQTRVYQQGHEEGLEKGREETAEAIAKRLLADGRPIAEIARLTKLTPTRIRKLKPNHKEK